jgi:alpha-1,3-rhamnosyl/mannosyltransferase
MKRRVRVAYDLRWIVRDRGGIATHALNLYRALLGNQDEFDLTAVIHPTQRPELQAYLPVGVDEPRVLPIAYSPLSPLGQLQLPLRLRQAGFEILHCPNYLGLMWPGRLKVVVTVHDLMAFLFPERCPQAMAVRYRALFRVVLGRSLRKASAVLADSQTTAGDIGRAFPDCLPKVEIVHSAVAPSFFDTPDDELVAETRSRYAGEGSLVLYVGRRDPNKNLVPLIRAIGALRTRGLDVRLVLAGIKDPRYPEPEQVARALGLAEVVHFPGFVGLGLLAALYRAADVLVFPSSYEGFGLPPLEAMASGTPVVASGSASIPEVVGDAALLVDPQRPDDLANGIQRVLQDAELRSELIRRGLVRARLFTWKSAADRVIQVYRKLK